MTLPATLPSRVLRRSFLFLLLTLATGAFAAPANFDIPAQPAPAALDLFIKQSGSQVVYLLADVADVRTNAVQGTYEPAAALELILKGTGLGYAQRKPGQFSVGRVSAKTGSIKGSLTDEGGRPVAGIRVEIHGTAEATTTDRMGDYAFALVPAGTYMLVATSPDYQPLHIVDVEVPRGQNVTIGKEEMHKPLGEVTKLDPLVVHAESVTELESYQVTDTQVKPFSGANVDLPRTIDDAQPYYIFDSKTIDQSGAINVGDFLKQRLTMNTTALSNAQASGVNPQGNLSSINLRGLGADKTLILVDGRRMAGVTIGSSGYLSAGSQPDVNGIPLSAIDRIEVLPTSASGIYGGSAIGGVINIILKKDYTGGEIRATYDNTFNTDSPTRTVAASYGFALEGGKTHVMLNASWSDSQPLLLEDRRGIYERNLATILRNDPLNSIYVANFSPFQGSLPNIMNDSGGFNSDFTLYVPDNLVLKNGTVLNGGITHVSAGTSPTTSAATLTAGLVANAGSWNTDLPATTQSPTGLFQPFGATPKTKSFQTSVNRQMLPKLEVFADFSYNENSSKSVYNPFGATSYTLAPDSPINPFTTSVDVSIPDATRVPMTTDSVSRSFTVGAIAQLPWSWTSELDYTWSQNRFQFLYYNLDSDALAADLESGAFNPFVDSLQYPLNVGKYLSPEAFGGTSTLDDIALRGSGPLGSLPWGTPDLTLGLEQRTAETPANTVAYNYPISTDESYTTTYFGRRSVTDSVYGELTVPLIKKDWLPLVHALELQLSGRGERYKVDTGTPYYNYNPSTGTTSYPVAPTLNGQPVFSKASYTSTNGTAGLKYQPVSELTLRASEATAFLPPTPDQLITNPLPSTTTTPVTDPNTGQRVRVTTLSGGNPNLKPQTSKSFDAGIIWEPHWSVLKGLRLDAEYYKIEQDNAIGALSAQTIVSLQSLYPNRVIRNSAGTITEVDISSLNLYKRDTEGWDLSADYTLKTGIGTFNLNAAESIILHLQNQYSPTLPDYDAVNFPSENGAAKYKANATLGWEWHNWSASWTARYFGSYKQYGAAGGPDSTQYYAGADDPTYTVAQGSDTIPSQTYHDFFLSYAFGKQHASSGSKLHTFESALLDGLTVQLGVRNIFNKVPPFDYYYSDNYYESPYGDLRLRSYWLSVKKTF